MDKPFGNCCVYLLMKKILSILTVLGILFFGSTALAGDRRPNNVRQSPRYERQEQRRHVERPTHKPVYKPAYKPIYRPVCKPVYNPIRPVTIYYFTIIIK